MLDSYRELIDELLGAPSEMRSLVSGAPSPEARRLVAQMRDRDRVVLKRLNRMMRSPDPRLDAVNLGEPDVTESLEDLLSEADIARGDLVSLLMNLTLKDWERVASHDVEGEITLAEEVEAHVDFDEAQLARIRAAVS
jgi:hypothetical protein